MSEARAREKSRWLTDVEAFELRRKEFAKHCPLSAPEEDPIDDIDGRAVAEVLKEVE